jgi:hypothetical protein
VALGGVETARELVPDLGRVKSIGYALGRGEIRLRDRAWLFFPARAQSTLRRWSIDFYGADDSQLLTDQQWDSVKPAMSAHAGRD